MPGGQKKVWSSTHPPISSLPLHFPFLLSHSPPHFLFPPPKFDVFGPLNFRRKGPKCLTAFRKSGSPSSTMWQSLVTIGQATSEIRRRKKQEAVRGIGLESGQISVIPIPCWYWCYQPIPDTSIGLSLSDCPRDITTFLYLASFRLLTGSVRVTGQKSWPGSISSLNSNAMQNINVYRQSYHMCLFKLNLQVQHGRRG